MASPHSFISQKPPHRNWLYRSCLTEVHHKAIIQTQPHRSPYRMTSQIHLIKLTFQNCFTRIALQHFLSQSPCIHSCHRFLIRRSVSLQSRHQKNAMEGQALRLENVDKRSPNNRQSGDSRILRKAQTLRPRAAAPKTVLSPASQENAYKRLPWDSKNTIRSWDRENAKKGYLETRTAPKKDPQGIPILKIPHP
jgi:hypothetical protein